MEWYQEQKVFYDIEVGPKRGVIHPVEKITQPGGSEVHPSSKALEQGTHVDASSPLEQFEIIPFFPMKIGDLYFSFINPSLFMLLTLSFFLLLLYFVTKKKKGGVPPFDKILKGSQRHSPNTRS